jgi:bifunctional DNA-binding transcriptional regulator/antitoxin component of YhaV-PrlF toxin-antitoxin module
VLEMTTKTKLYKDFQTVVPIEARKKFDVDLDDI